MKRAKLPYITEYHRVILDDTNLHFDEKFMEVNTTLEKLLIKGSQACLTSLTVLSTV